MHSTREVDTQFRPEAGASSRGHLSSRPQLYLPQICNSIVASSKQIIMLRGWLFSADQVHEVHIYSVVSHG
jgi:hypothetical protein